MTGLIPADKLNVLLGDVKIGEVRRNVSRGGALTFVYEEGWVDREDAVPLSLSMPLVAREHGNNTIQAFLWGLLPDDMTTLKRWGETFQVSPRSAFALLEHVGEDCAGAVQFVSDAKRAALCRSGGVRWLSEDEIGQRLGDLRRGAATGRRQGDPGQFSLAGAQSKTAFHYDAEDRRWGVPTGRIPTTHIFKPPLPAFAGHTENEHFCLRLARRAGLLAANSQVLTFAGEKAIVVERYDRVRTLQGVVRVHQEDVCQALGIHPEKKYEKEGGPGIVRIVTDTLAAAGRHAETDRRRFIEAIVFNFLIAGTDAHAKNFSMLLSSKGARLAPLYDLASILPHLKAGEVRGDGAVMARMRDLRLSMRIADKYVISDIMPRHWLKMGTKARISGAMALGFVRHHIATLPDLAADTARECRESGIDHAIIDSLVDAIGQRAQALAVLYGSEALADGALPARSSAPLP